jgi:hypothetical protein
MVGWWRAQDNALDSSGFGHHGSLLGEAGFIDGVVGRAFAFPNSDTPAAVKIAASPALNVGVGGGFTLEAWILPRNVNRRGAIFEWNNSQTNDIVAWGVHLQILEPHEFGLGAGNLIANVWGANGFSYLVMAPGGTLTNGGFQHVALTFIRSNGLARLYRNGEMVAQQTFGLFTPLTTYDLFLGRRPAGDNGHVYTFDGAIDEAAVFNRALSADEVMSIYRAGTNGHCVHPPTRALIRVSQVEVAWASLVGQWYQVQYRTNPPAGSWQPLGAPVPGNGTTNRVIDDIVVGEPRRFYRIEEVSQ